MVFCSSLSRPDGAGADQSDSPPPIPPVRCSSVSREKRFGIDVPLPPLPAKPKFDDPNSTSTKPSPPEVKSRPPEAANRRAPPVPPAPKRAGAEIKPPAPPLPMHRRSKSEGRSPFGEDIPLGKDSKPPFERKLSSPLDKQEEARPNPPPRPLKAGSVSVRVKSSSPLLENGEITSRSVVYVTQTVVLLSHTIVLHVNHTLVVRPRQVIYITVDIACEQALR